MIFIQVLNHPFFKRFRQFLVFIQVQQRFQVFHSTHSKTTHIL